MLADAFRSQQRSLRLERHIQCAHPLACFPQQSGILIEGQPALGHLQGPDQKNRIGAAAGAKVDNPQRFMAVPGLLIGIAAVQPPVELHRQRPGARPMVGAFSCRQPVTGKRRLTVSLPLAPTELRHGRQEVHSGV